MKKYRAKRQNCERSKKKSLVTLTLVDTAPLHISRHVFASFGLVEDSSRYSRQLATFLTLDSYVPLCT